VAVLALASLRMEAAGADEGAILVVGQALVAIHDWTFKLGPGSSRASATASFSA
jgi:hypothetical protein